MTKRNQLLMLGAIAAILVAGVALAKPRNGDMGVYLDGNGQVVGTWVVSCDGEFGWSGQRTSNSVTNGQLFCVPR